MCKIVFEATWAVKEIDRVPINQPYVQNVFEATWAVKEIDRVPINQPYVQNVFLGYMGSQRDRQGSY